MAKNDRFHPGSPSTATRTTDVRTDSERDRDRILYTSAFRRLAEVTQVVGPLEGHVFHNRLTHTAEVAQIARRLSQRLNRTNPDLVKKYGEIDVEMAEAAALAHDLGHPPYGHIAEKELNALVMSVGNTDGFEGNAQSFRILTKLAAHRHDYPGLNLTRATLNAVLKYPWFKGDGPADKADKFGAYRTESELFNFARAESSDHDQSIEAAVMDHADAIAYSVHDLDDFFRAGLVPLERLTDETFFERELELFKASKKVPENQIGEHRAALFNFTQLIPGKGRFGGTRQEREDLRTFSARLINDFVSEVTLAVADERLVLLVPPQVQVLMRFLQNLVWRHVIMNPKLATQQHGQRAVIRDLFSIYHKAICDGPGQLQLIPLAFQASVEQLSRLANPQEVINEQARLAADIVASLTDSQAVILFRRLTGHAPGSVMDHISS